MHETYRADSSSHNRFGEIRESADSFEKLLLVGRNGMHKYKNPDHAMLTAMITADNIEAGVTRQGEPLDGEHGTVVLRR